MRLYTFFTWEIPMKTQISTFFSLDCQKKVKRRLKFYFANKEFLRKRQFFAIFTI